MTSVALSIAGSDPSGGAGVQVDLKTFHQHGVYGQAVPSLLTAQNTLGVSRVVPVAADFLAEQLDALLADMPPHAVKTGALFDEDAVAVVAERVRSRRLTLVVDPVAQPTRGLTLAQAGMIPALVRDLLPLAVLVTPNALEASSLSGVDVRDVESAIEAGRRLLELGPQAVLVKGGHFQGSPVDVLCERGGPIERLPGRRVRSEHTHGTGCTYSAAICARLARGESLGDAVRGAKAWLRAVLEGAPLGLGQGRGPLNLWAGG